MPETIQSVGKQISFSDLFKEFQRVQIPIIQRDYAQGRAGQEELRSEFLSALKQALDRDQNDPRVPLDLDFVYGSAFGRDGSTAAESFAPLDGQQRLTTLFLLHWYLAWKDDKTADFRERFLNDGRSRLVYEVRPSSHDFFDGLALNFPTEAANNIDSLNRLIQDQPWFFRSWKYDPTIVSALTMLDDIHQMFAKSEGYYQRLVVPDYPRITFQLLELEHFGLSDDLYIKMNARGKPLTAFENFKARLEQHLDELLRGETKSLHGHKVTIKEYFSRRMDTTWADLFWAHRNPETNLYDDELMRLIKAVALVSMDPDKDVAEDIVVDLRRSGVSFSRLLESGCLSVSMLQTLIAVLDQWSGENHDNQVEDAVVLDSAAAFRSATSRELSYPELAKFAAFCVFVRTHTLPLDPQGLARWMRVISNLVEHSDIERPSDFVNALRSLAQLEAHTDNILEYLVEGSEVPAFNRQQVREERIKGALILKEAGWGARIFAAERHGYFRGQIEFLLKFSGILDHWLESSTIAWSEKDDADVQKQFDEYLRKAEAVFDVNGLRRFNDNKWERALLALGDYTLSYGKNHSFLQNSFRERRPTWKLLLRGDMTDSSHEQKRLLVKTLLERVDLKGGLEGSLDKIIETTPIDEQWRDMLVRVPQMIGYCSQRMFRHIGNGTVYLISKLRTSSDHVELWTYYLYCTFLTHVEALSPISAMYLNANNEDYVPFARLEWCDSKGRSVVIRIKFADEQFLLELTPDGGNSAEFWLTQLGKIVQLRKEDDSISLTASRDEIQPILGKIVGIAREHARAAK